MAAKNVSTTKKKGFNVYQGKFENQFDPFGVNFPSNNWKAISDPFALTNSTGTIQQTLELNVDFDLFLQYYEDANQATDCYKIKNNKVTDLPLRKRIIGLVSS
jgi:hypothetical protein